MNPVLVRFQDELELQVQPDPRLEWTLSNEQVAEGYGVTVSSLRSTKSRHSDELVQDKHWIVLQIATGSLGARDATFWTKRGIIRLGFFIRSERARKFRDFYEDLVLEFQSSSATQAAPVIPDKLIPISSTQLPEGFNPWQLYETMSACMSVMGGLPIAAFPELHKNIQAGIHKLSCSANMTEAFAANLFRERFELKSYHGLELESYGQAMAYLEERMVTLKKSKEVKK